MIPLTKYGLPQVVVYPLVFLAILVLIVLFGTFLPAAVFWVLFIAVSAVFVWIMAFFRDPPRKIPDVDDFLLSPADGKITAAEEVQDDRFKGGKAFRISIFLSIFNVHINRMPADCIIEKIEYKPGKYLNAMKPECAKVNEANELTVRMVNAPGCRLLVRQVSGAIARRIVCEPAEGDKLKIGEKFGMIKFGSCTELYIPLCDFECLVKEGESVKAGLTKLIRFISREQ